MKHDTLYELTLEFYTTFEFLNGDTYLFLCRLFRRKFHIDCELMTYIFGFPIRELKQPLSEFDMLTFC